MISKVFITVLLSLLGTSAFCQEYLEWDDHQIDKFYEKLVLPEGTLDEKGDTILHIYVISELEGGVYDIELSAGDGSIFEIIDAGLYIKFKSDRGIAGHVIGRLVVNGRDWRFYEKP